MRKIFLLTPFDIFPPVHGGAASSYFIIKNLARNNHVYVLLTHLYSRNGPIDMKTNNADFFYCPRSVFDRLKVVSILFNPFYYLAAYEVMRRNDCDLMQCQVLWTSLCGIFVKKLFNKPLILVEHNVEYLKFRDFKAPFFLTLFIRKLEKIACHLADRVLVFTENDRDSLVELYNIKREKVAIITPSPDFDPHSREDRIERIRTVRLRYGLNDNDCLICFVGNLKYIPNKLAANVIANEIYPKIIKIYPRTKFLIIGQGFEELAPLTKENIIFTGYLNEIDFIDHLLSSDFMIVPILQGSGIRRKILEAAICSVPCVSTTKGAEGIDLAENIEILLAENTDKEFVDKILLLIGDKQLRIRLGENARKKVKDRYSWAQEVKKIETIFSELVANNED